MADGGFSVKGDENFQEELLRRLVLSQFTTCLQCLAPGGSFVCKVFDMFTPFSRELFAVTSLLFERVCITKPYTSRPANSERYVVGIGLRAPLPRALVNHWDAAIAELGSIDKSATRDMVGILAPGAVDRPAFAAALKYVERCNAAVSRGQVGALEELVRFMEDPKLPLLADQADVTIRCLREWNLPEPKALTAGLAKADRPDQDDESQKLEIEFAPGPELGGSVPRSRVESAIAESQAVPDKPKVVPRARGPGIRRPTGKVSERAARLKAALAAKAKK